MARAAPLKSHQAVRREATPLPDGCQEIIDEISVAHAAETMPHWSTAYSDAVKAALAECRPSTQLKFGPHIGDWFAITAIVPASALPAALKIGIGRKYSFDFKKSTPKRFFGMIRLPMARYWHHAWRDIINRAIIENP